MSNSADHMKATRWKPGQSGNPAGPKGGKLASLSASLKRIGVKKAKSRQVIAEIAKNLGYTPEDMTNMDLVASLIYDSTVRLLYLAVGGNVDAGQKVCGLVDLLFRATDGEKHTVDLHATSDTFAALSGVSRMLGFDPPEDVLVKRMNGSTNGKRNGKAKTKA